MLPQITLDAPDAGGHMHFTRACKLPVVMSLEACIGYSHALDRNPGGVLNFIL